jgi:uncharacterized protein (TIGR02147 family)
MAQTATESVEIPLHEYDDYRAYLLDRIARSPNEGRGIKASIARHIGCQPTYVSAVLKGAADFSLEQAEGVSAFLGHGEEETHFWLLLVQIARAGTPSLRDYFKRRLREAREKRLHLKHRLQLSEVMSDRARQTYFSSWYYAAIHAVIPVPGCETVEGISRLLGLERALVSQVVGFLVEQGLVARHGSHLVLGVKQIHLPHDSPLISKHHANWRLVALASLTETAQTSSSDRLHYSSITAISYKDAVRIREKLMSEIERVKELVRISPEEAPYSFSLDFFPLK